MNEHNTHVRLMRLVTEVKRDMLNANIPFDDTVPFIINSRLSRSLGRCHFNRVYGAIKIDIAQIVIDCPDDMEIKNVICHELIHSARICLTYGHGGMWKIFANKMNQTNQNYHITTVHKDNTFGKHDEQQRIGNTKRYKFKVQCQHCDMSQCFTRETKIVKAIKDGYGNRIRCPKCHQNHFKLFELKGGDSNDTRKA